MRNPQSRRTHTMGPACRKMRSSPLMLLVPKSSATIDRPRQARSHGIALSVHGANLRTSVAPPDSAYALQQNCPSAMGPHRRSLKGLSARNRLHKSHCCTSSVDRAPRDHANVTNKVAVSLSYLATLVEGYLDDALRMPWKNWKALPMCLARAAGP